MAVAKFTKPGVLTLMRRSAPHFGPGADEKVRPGLLTKCPRMKFWDPYPCQHRLLRRSECTRGLHHVLQLGSEHRDVACRMAPEAARRWAPEPLLTDPPRP